MEFAIVVTLYLAKAISEGRVCFRSNFEGSITAEKAWLQMCEAGSRIVSTEESGEK